MIINRYKVTILFCIVIIIGQQPEFHQDHHYRPYYKHSHDHNHAHHLKHLMEHNHDHHHKHPHNHGHDHHRRSPIRKASRIYNGVRTPSGEAKFMAAIMKNRRQVHCSAVIITDRILLTAAHCFSNKSDDLLSRLKAFPAILPLKTYRNRSHSDHPLIRNVVSFLVHPRYETSLNQRLDIAIATIGPEPWPLGDEVETALMPVRVKSFDLSVIKVYGFGREIGEVPAKSLNELSLNYLWTHRQCEIRLNFERARHSNILFGATNWSPDPRKNPKILTHVAHGDSGGGVFFQGTVERLDRSTNKTIEKHGLILTGITSRGKNFFQTIADLSRPYGVLAVNVTTAMSWIKRVTATNFETHPPLTK